MTFHWDSCGAHAHVHCRRWFSTSAKIITRILWSCCSGIPTTQKRRWEKPAGGILMTYLCVHDRHRRKTEAFSTTSQKNIFQKNNFLWQTECVHRAGDCCNQCLQTQWHTQNVDMANAANAKMQSLQLWLPHVGQLCVITVMRATCGSSTDIISYELRQAKHTDSVMREIKEIGSSQKAERLKKVHSVRCSFKASEILFSSPLPCFMFWCAGSLWRKKGFKSVNIGASVILRQIKQIVPIFRFNLYS